jgi:NADH-quinone oxidoreductase subunit N
MMSELTVLLPAILLTVTGLTVLVADVFVPRGRDSRPLLGLIASAGILAAGWVLVSETGRGLRESPAPQIVLGGAAVRDAWGLYLQIGVWLSLALTLFSAGGTLRRDGVPPGEFYGLLLLGAAGMMLLAVSQDLMMIFLSVEILSVALYALTALPRGSARAVEGGMKYFILGGVASACMLYGMAMAYGASGRIDLAGIGQHARGGLALIGMGLLLVGLAFKIGAAPFHMWVPDAYEGAPAVVTGFMAAAVKVSAFGALVRILYTAFPSLYVEWGSLLEIIAIVTLVVGNLAALGQTNVKRLLAYSSIAHTGFILIGVVSADRGTVDGASASAFYLLVYALMTLGAFALLSMSGRDGKDLETLADCAGLSRRHPVRAATLTFLLVSMAGIPPTAGFLAKFYVFREAVVRGHLPLAVIGLLGALVAAYYYLRPVVSMYMEPTQSESEDRGDALERDGETDWAVVAAVAIAAGLVLWIGLFPSGIHEMAGRAVIDLRIGR